MRIDMPTSGRLELYHQRVHWRSPLGSWAELVSQVECLKRSPVEGVEDGPSQERRPPDEAACSRIRAFKDSTVIRMKKCFERMLEANMGNTGRRKV